MKVTIFKAPFTGETGLLLSSGGGPGGTVRAKICVKPPKKGYSVTR